MNIPLELTEELKEPKAGAEAAKVKIREEQSKKLDQRQELKLTKAKNYYSETELKLSQWLNLNSNSLHLTRDHQSRRFERSKAKKNDEKKLQN